MKVRLSCTISWQSGEELSGMRGQGIWHEKARKLYDYIEETDRRTCIDFCI